MLTILIFVLLLLFLVNGQCVSKQAVKDPLWGVLIILLVIWILFATGVIGDYGYFHW